MKDLRAGWVSHGEVVLSWGSVEQAGHEHMTDEFKTNMLLM